MHKTNSCKSGHIFVFSENMHAWDFTQSLILTYSPANTGAAHWCSIHQLLLLQCPTGYRGDGTAWCAHRYSHVTISTVFGNTYVYMDVHMHAHKHAHVHLHWSSGRPRVICTALLFHHWIFSTHHVGWNECTNSCRYKTIMYHHSYYHHSNHSLQYHSYQHYTTIAVQMCIAMVTLRH